MSDYNWKDIVKQTFIENVADGVVFVDCDLIEHRRCLRVRYRRGADAPLETTAMYRDQAARTMIDPENVLQLKELVKTGVGYGWLGAARIKSVNEHH